MRIPEKKNVVKLAAVMIVATVVMTIFSIPILSIPSLGKVLFPGDGFWNIPSEVPKRDTMTIPGLLDKVTVIRETRAVEYAK